MGLLAQVLPALREVRGALAGGFLWLAFGWLMVGEHVPDDLSKSDERVWTLVGRLEDQLGTSGLVAVLSVAAYLVGSLVGELVERITQGTKLQADSFRNQAELIEQEDAAR